MYPALIKISEGTQLGERLRAEVGGDILGCQILPAISRPPPKLLAQAPVDLDTHRFARVTFQIEYLNLTVAADDNLGRTVEPGEEISGHLVPVRRRSERSVPLGDQKRIQPSLRRVREAELIEDETVDLVSANRPIDSPRTAPGSHALGARMKLEVNPVDSLRRLSRLRAAVFLVGTAAVGVGLWLARSKGNADHPVGQSNEALENYYLEIAPAAGIVLLGALIAAIAASGMLPDRLAGRSLAFVRPWGCRRSRQALVAGLTSYAAVLSFVLLKDNSPLVFLLFMASLALLSVAIHRADSSRSGHGLGFRKVDAVILPILAVLILALNLVELTHWKFSSVGDEWVFFQLAKHLAEEGGRSLFDLVGVYETHPVLDSAYQALFLKVFGANIVAWRLAEIFALVVSALLIYALVLILFGRVPAIVAATILGCNHLLMAFARIGYNNLHCVFWALLVLLFLVLAWLTGRALFVFLTGTAMGFCIYSFAVAFLVWPLVAVLVAIKFLRRPTMRELAAVALMFVGFLLVITPGLLTTPPQHVFDMAVHQSQREAAAEDPALVAQMTLVRSSLVFWVNPTWFKHHVGGPLLDVVTGILFSIGCAIGLLHIRNGAARVAFFWFVMGLLILALTNYVPRPLFTRLLFLIPACAILASMGAFCLEAAFKGLRVPSRLTTGAILGLTAFIPILNLNQLLVKSPRVVSIDQHTITMKAIHENPDQVIIEVGQEPNVERSEMVRASPGLQENYEFFTVDDLLLPPSPMGMADTMPIYLLHEHSLYERLREKLPPTYVVETDAGVNGNPKIWLFKATKEARPKPQPGEESLARVDNPKFVFELRIRPSGGAQHAWPQDLAVGSDGSFYVACSGDNTIRRFRPDGVALEVWGNTDPARPVFEELFAIAGSPDGTLYALDAGAGTIYRFSESGDAIAAPIKDLGCYYPRGLSIDANGDLLVADTGRERVLRLDRNGVELEVIEAPVWDQGRLGEPIDAAAHGDDSLLVFYARNFVMAHLGPQRKVEVAWPIRETVTAKESGHFALDSADRIFLCAASDRRVVVFDTAGKRLAMWPQTLHGQPVGIFVDENGGVFVTFPAQDLVRKYQLRRWDAESSRPE